MRLVRSRDQRQMLSQISRKRRTTQRASHVPSGFPHASHSFCGGNVGLGRCVEIAKRVMIAMICSRTESEQGNGAAAAAAESIGRKVFEQPTICLPGTYHPLANR